MSSFRHFSAPRCGFAWQARRASSFQDAIAMPQSHLRKARMDIVLASATKDAAAAPLPPGEWFVEQRTEVLRVFKDAQGTEHVADVPVVDFLDGLATRQIVFVSWG